MLALILRWEWSEDRGHPGHPDILGPAGLRQLNDKYLAKLVHLPISHSTTSWGYTCAKAEVSNDHWVL